MPLISIVLNCDTRAGFQENNTQQQGLFKGCVSEDFILEGLKNKIRLFDGFDIQPIIYVDEHQPLPDGVLDEIRKLADIVVINKFKGDFHARNDKNYQNALFLSRGDYIAHFDADCAAFSAGKEAVQEMIDLLEQWKFVSYPSWHSPDCKHDDAYNYRWASTRFFICKRETLDFTEIVKTQKDYQYYIEKYNPSRVNHWTEHIISLVAGNSVYYPPIQYEKLMIFTWAAYNKGTLQMLNNMSYEEVKQWVFSRGGIHNSSEVNG